MNVDFVEEGGGALSISRYTEYVVLRDFHLKF